jgi:hypothetical protein
MLNIKEQYIQERQEILQKIFDILEVYIRSK